MFYWSDLITLFNKIGQLPRDTKNITEPFSKIVFGQKSTFICDIIALLRSKCSVYAGYTMSHLGGNLTL